MQSRIVSGFLLGYGQPGNCPTAQLILSLTSRLRAWYDKHVRNYAPTLFGAFSFLAQAVLPVAPFVSVFLSAVAVLRHLCSLTSVFSVLHFSCPRDRRLLSSFCYLPALASVNG